MSPNLAPGRTDKHFEGERTAILLTLLTLTSRMKNIVQHWLRRKGAQTSARTPQLQLSCSILAVQPYVTPPGQGARLWSQSTAEICLWYLESAGKPINSFDTSSSSSHPSWNLAWMFNPCWILKVVQALHAEAHLFPWYSRLVLLSYCAPWHISYVGVKEEECRVRITKTKQLNISCAVEATASSSFYLFFTSADQWCKFFSGVWGKISLSLSLYHTGNKALHMHLVLLPQVSPPSKI